MNLYDRLGFRNDSTRSADPSITERVIRHLRMRPGGKCLDVACGTGNYTTAIARGNDFEVFGLDRSKTMIDAARKKSSSVLWHVGDAEFLPFADDSFSGVLCTLGVHHFERLRAAVGEICRVLADGRFVVFTATPTQMKGYWLNEYFPLAMARSMKQMPTLHTLAGSMESVGLRRVYTEIYEVEEGLQDLFLYSGKARPETYLNSRVREGISTFASLADPEEVKEGCRRLAADIESGRVEEVMSAYRHGEGDYLFAVAEK